MPSGNRKLLWAPDLPSRELLEVDGVEVELTPEDPAASPRVAEVEILVPGHAAPKALDRMSSLRLIQTLSAGVNTVVDQLPDGVTLCNARGVHDGPVAEWVLAALLADAKQIPLYRDAQGEARWTEPWVRELAAQTVLLVGYGSIARAVEERLAPFGAEIVRVGRHAHGSDVHAEGDLPELLPDADAVVILVPLTEATKGMVDAEFLASMRDGAVLVNAARGPIVDPEDLLAELQKERIRAIVDVTDPEPLPDGDPLWSAPGIFITPHIAGTTDNWMVNAFGFARDQVRRYLGGEPLENVIEGDY